MFVTAATKQTQEKAEWNVRIMDTSFKEQFVQIVFKSLMLSKTLFTGLDQDFNGMDISAFYLIVLVSQINN